MSFDSKSPIREDRLLAVVSVGLTVPGAANAERFWEAILAGERFFSLAQAQDFGTDPDQFLEPGPPAPDKVYSLSGAFNRALPSGNALNKITAGWDKSSRYLMEAAWESLNLKGRNKASPYLAGHDPRQIGLIVGQVALPTWETAQGALATLGRDWTAKLGLDGETEATLDGFKPTLETFATVGASARQVAETLGFQGPAFTVDAACASSLYALKLAALELFSQRLTAVVAGGVAAPDRLFTQMGFCQLRALSPSGLASPFDERADGLVVGEGAGLLLLKRLDRALADGDQPLALISGIGLSNDQGGGLLAPEKNGQLRAMARAWQAAGLDAQNPDSAGVGLVEAHGTGTPVGDGVELAALNEFWSSSRQRPGPALGSVKGNIGHLLSAAGALGLIKAVMALKNHLLPPSGGFNKLGPSLDLGPFRILKTALAWPEPSSGVRRALVNAFGFGGANAQVVLEEFRPGDARAASPAPVVSKGEKCSKLAVVGWTGVGGPGAAGFGREKLVLDALAYRTSPKELRALLPQQFLLLKAGHELWDQLGLPEENLDFDRLGVFVGLDLDPQASDYVLRWRWAEPAFKRLALEHAYAPENLAAFKDSFIPPLDHDGTVGALGSIAASRLAKFLKIGGPAFTLSSGKDSGLTALRAAADFLRTGLLDLALVGAVDTPGDLKMTLTAPGTNWISGAAVLALTSSELAEAWNLPIWAEYDPEGYDSTNKISLPESGVEAGAATNFFRLAEGLDWLAKGLRPDAAGELRPWLADAHNGPRSLGVIPEAPHRPATWLAAPERPLVYFNRSRLGPAWFFIPDADPASELESLEDWAGASPDIYHLARRHWLERAYAAKSWKLGLAASDLESLKILVADVRAAWLQGERLNHPQTLWVSEKPRNGGLALVFPGSGNHYPRMCLPWAEAAPGAVADLMAESAYLASQFQPELFMEAAQWPKPLAVQEVILGQVAFDSLVYKTLKQLNLKAEAVLGYSLGESAALVATGAWPNRDALFLRLNSSSLFTKDLAGEYRAARQYWALTADEPLDWSVAVVGVGFSQFQAAWGDLPLEQRERVFLLLINTQEECVIGGESRAVETLGRLLGHRLTLLNGVAAVHNPTVQPVAEAYRALHLIETGNPANLKYYSPARGRAYPLTSEAAADSITEQALSGHNFVRLINQAHQDGIRFFLEVGPGGSATRMIKSILKGRPYWARSLDAPGSADLEAAVRILAELTLQERPVNWARLYEGPEFKKTPAPGLPVELDLRRPEPDWDRWDSESGRGGTGAAVSKSLPNQPEAARAEDPAAPKGGGSHFSERPSALTGDVPAGKLEDLRPHEVSTAPPLTPPPLTAESPEIKIEDHVGPAGRKKAAPAAKGKTAKNKISRGRPRKLSLDDQWAAVGVVAAKSETGPGGRGRPRKKASAGESGRLFEPSPDPSSAAGDLGSLIRSIEGEPEGAPWAQAAKEVETSYWQWLKTFDDLAQDSGALDSPPQERATPRSFDRAACLAFAVGTIAEVLGPQYAQADRHPTRVRLPGEPLMLVDRILEIEGPPLELQPARIVTEHDVLPEGGWYLENGHIPASLAVESGQGDLFLAAYLGMDFITKGLTRYRLLDAEVTMHRELPRSGETVKYDIRILRFFKHNHIHLFRFEFDAVISGQLALTMRNGCAGFFTPDELASGKGVPAAPLADRLVETPVDYREAALAPVENLSPLDSLQMAALRKGDLQKAFGPDFSGLSLDQPLTLPGGRFALIDRVVQIALTGGRYGQGLIRAEADIDPEAWFLTCHFVDDQVMPGTLMFEGCLHALRIFLLRLGWVDEQRLADWQPVLGIKAGLKCRGQVTGATKTVTYEVHLKELAFLPEPYALADAVMYADGRPIVDLTGLSLRLRGGDRGRLARQWAQAAERKNLADDFKMPEPGAPAAFEKEALASFTEGGPPSALFGPLYEPLDQDHFVARLPRGDYALLDRVLAVEAPAGGRLEAGGRLWAEFQSRPDNWYLLEAGGRTPRLPYAILNEIALQPCGFLAAYLGSALESQEDLRFRNLGGRARLLVPDQLAAERFLTRAEVTKISRAGDLIIEHFNFQVFTGPGRPVYEGQTYFGFFTPQALAAQTGLSADENDAPKLLAAFASSEARPVDLSGPAWPRGRLAVLDRIELGTGPDGLRLVKGEVAVDPKAWFFHDHFFQDPVWPGSLGLEAFWLLGKAAAREAFGGPDGLSQERIDWRAPRSGPYHEWIYRGQVIPANQKVEVIAQITDLDQASRSLTVNGYLLVDGLPIYKVTGFSLAVTD